MSNRNSNGAGYAAPSAAALFADDDEETLKLLLSGSVVANNDSLKAVTQRFLEDHATNSSAELFDSVVQDVPGFTPGRVAYQHHAAPTELVGASVPAPQQIPASLQSSEAGKLHLKAVQEALHVSETAALQLTLGALLKQSSGTDATGESSRNRSNNTTIQWSQLIGTRSLLIQTCEYYFQQRVARINAIAELLRRAAEEDNGNDDDDTNGGPTSPSQSSLLLDPLDAVTTTTNISNNNKRGLFRMLLFAACQPEAVVQRDDFLAAQKLTAVVAGASTSTSKSREEREREDAAWKQLIVTVLERQRLYQQRERCEALEALLVLLYSRMTVYRSDLAVLVTAFQRLHFFGNNYNTNNIRNCNPRLSRLAGLICVESMALWRIFSVVDNEDDVENNNPSDAGVDWKQSHPLLQGVEAQDPVAGEELRALESLFRAIVRNVDERWTSQSPEADHPEEAPESLILLSFGLLLHAAGTSRAASSGSAVEADDRGDNEMAKTFRSTGMELAELANGEIYDALGYLRRTMQDMVISSTTTVLHTTLRDFLPFDLITFHGNDLTENPLDLVGYSGATENDKHELFAASLAYASIGREVLTASIQTFSPIILPMHKVALPENLSQLSRLVAVIFRNSPILCSRFWASWEEYTLDYEVPSPLCRLLKSAHKRAMTTLVAHGQHHLRSSHDEAVLLATTPLLELVASLVYDAQNLEEVLVAIVPPNLLRCVLAILKARSGITVQSPEFIDCRKRFLHSLSVLASIGDSDRCRELIRNSMEEESPTMGQNNVQSPRTLARIVTKSRDPVEIAEVFGVFAALTVGAPFGWIFDSVKALGDVLDDSIVWRGLFEQNEICTQATVRFMTGLVESLHKLVFTPLLDDSVIVEMLSVIKSGVSSACELLPTFLSTLSPRDQARRSPLKYSTVSLIIDMLCILVQQLRFTMEFHKSERVTAAASAFLDGVIGALAAGLSESICYFATAPLSLSVSESLDATLQDPSILQAIASVDENSGLFPSFRQVDQDVYVDRVVSLLVKKLEDVDNLNPDQEVHDVKKEGVMRASLSALRFLNVWFRCIETKLTQPHNTDISDVDVSGVSPARVLVAPCILPPCIRGNSLLSSAWSKAGVSMIDLLLSHLGNNNTSTIEKLIASEAFDTLSSFLHHGRFVFPSGGSLIFRRISQSTLFRKVLAQQLDKLQSLMAKPNFSSSDKTDVSVVLRFLRLLGAVFESGSFVASMLVSKNDDMVKCLCDVVSGVLSNVNRTSSMTELSADGALIDRLRIANGCLGALCSLWEYSRTTSSSNGNDIGGSEALRNIVEASPDFVRELAVFVFHCSSEIMGQTDTLDDQTKVPSLGRIAILTLVSTALKLLVIEAAWALNRAGFESNAPIVRALEDLAWNGKLELLVDATKAFGHVGGFLPYSVAVEKFVSYPGVKLLRNQTPSELSYSNLLISSGPAFQVFCDGLYDTTFADKWFSSLAQAEGARTTATTLVSAIGQEYTVLVSELECLQSWSTFAQTQNQLFAKWRRETPEDGRFTVSSSAFSLAMSLANLTALRKNIGTVEALQLSLTSSFLTNEYRAMTKASSCLLLSFCRIESIEDCAPKEWIEAMRLVAEIAKTVSMSFSNDSAEEMAVMQQLLASASILSTDSLSKEFVSRFNFDWKSRVEVYYIDLVATMCRVVKSLSRSTLPRKDIENCLITAVSGLGAIIEKTVADSDCSWQMDFNFSEHIGNTFAEFDTVRFLVALTGVEWSTGFSSISPSDAWRGSVILQVLNLLTKIAASGDSNMLGLLFVNDVALALLSRYRVTSSGSFDNPSMRGYFQKDAGLSADTVGFIDDLAHRVWRGSMEFLAACLRSLRRDRNASKSGSANVFKKVAVDFIRENRVAVLGCLSHCSSVEFGPYASTQCAFTLNVVREAKLILSILSELCEEDAIAMFEQQSPELLNMLIAKSASVAVSLSTFLGASATSRDIFIALDDVDEARAMTAEHGLHLSALGPVYRILAGGLQNAKHEAIRFSSHFVLNCTRAMTSDDRDAQTRPMGDRWKPMQPDQPGTLAALEQTCRSGVSSVFSFQIESEAADCLFFAMRVLLKTHPASSSFVEYSAEEAMIGDFMRFVKPGMVIAFRPENVSGLFLPASNQESEEQAAGDRVQFGRVCELDTLRRQWSVELETPGSQSEVRVVNERQLAGIEDPSKRICMFSSRAAPESSSDLENLGHTISVGHLILALRWCSQMSSETANTSTWSIQRLAELTSALLATELQVQLEARLNLDSSEREAYIKIHADALLDLFGEAHEFGLSVDGQRVGRLKSVVSGESWESVRSQLNSYLSVAVAELNTQHNEKALAIATERGSLFIRQSSDGSSFYGW